jgi:hypothetical protein
MTEGRNELYPSFLKQPLNSYKTIVFINRTRALFQDIDRFSLSVFYLQKKKKK